MTEEATLDKIRKLLRKAESTPYEEEAAAFFEKAQELMLRYAIDEELLWKHDPSKRSKPVIVDVPLTGDKTGAMFKRVILNACAINNRCRMWYNHGDSETGVICGYQNDVILVEMLYSTIMVQQGMAMAIAMATHDVRGAGPIKNFKMNFLQGYSNRIWHRLADQKKTREAQPTTGMELVLVRQDEVDRVADDILGNARSRPLRPTHKHDANAYAAGKQAGDATDLGGAKLGGSRAKAIEK